MNESRSQVKPFDIPKQMVWEAYQRVKANKGAAGVDGQSVEQFEQDLRNNLYRLWNRMSSGSYFPPPVKAVEIPKASGGVRILGVPTVADRIAQTVVAMFLERLVEPVFHPDSYGYRPGRSALDAVAVCRERCWRNDWIIDLDVRAFFDSVDHFLMLKAVERNAMYFSVNGCSGPPPRFRMRPTGCSTESNCNRRAWRRPGCRSGRAAGSTRRRVQTGLAVSAAAGGAGFRRRSAGRC